MNTHRQNTCDVEFIVSQTRRLSSMPIEDLRAIFQGRKDEWLYQLPRAEGTGGLLCGKEAYFKLATMAKRYLSTQGDLSERIERDRFRNAVGKELAKRFLNEKRSIDDKQTTRMLAAALKLVKKRVGDFTHFAPCVMFFDRAPAEYTMGPVRFIWMKDFLAENNDHIIRKHPELASRDILPYYSCFQWVAEVTIPQCDESTSRVRANAVVEGALDAFRLLIGKSYTATFRQGHMPASLSETASLRRDRNGQFGFSFTKEWKERHAPDSWYEKLQHEATPYLALTGKALEGLVEPSKASHLTQRFLDSLNWYGQAVKEDNSGAAIVKYVAALERITIATKPKNKDIIQTLCQRVALLSSEGSTQQYEIQHALAKDIYNFRSELMHGSLSPLDVRLKGIRTKAQRITRFSLLAGLAFFSKIEKVKPKARAADLEIAYKHLRL